MIESAGLHTSSPPHTHTTLAPHPKHHQWAVFLTNNANLSLLLVTIVRNILIVFFTTHISGCLFYYIARQTEGMSWMVAANDWLPGGADVGTFERYIYSLYFATVTFATVGYGGEGPCGVVFALHCVVCCCCRVVVLQGKVGRRQSGGACTTRPLIAWHSLLHLFTPPTQTSTRTLWRKQPT